MKRLLNKEVLEIDIQFIFSIAEDDEIAADTLIRPVGLDKESNTIDFEAKADYTTFVLNIFEMLDYYDFEILEDYSKTSKSFPYTSEYRWIAHRTEIDSDNVPKYIHLRISEHVQKFNKDRARQLKAKYKEEADAIKRPKTKKVQRFNLENINVANMKCTTYEEALHEVEAMIRQWLIDRNVDMTDYDVIGW